MEKQTRAFPPPPSFNTPNKSEIWFCQDIPLDNTYKNTFFFSSRSAQIDWFKSKAKLKDNGDPYTYNNMTQIRLQGQLKVSQHVGNLQNVNYIIFHNPNFDNANIERQIWYFAFVMGVEYNNPNTTIVNYEIDVFQTWQFYFKLAPSYVVRETPDNDYLFENTQPEGLEHGPMVTVDTKYLSLGDKSLNPIPIWPMPLSDWVICYYHTEAVPTGTNVDNMYWMPFDTSLFTLTDYATLRDFFEHNGHKIIAGYIVPRWMTIDRVRNQQYELNQDFNTMVLELNYKPKNKKLYCYPYTFLEVDNNLGQTQILRWENWDTYKSPGIRDCVFSISSSFGMIPEVSLMPWNYLGNGSSITGSLQLTYSDFPQVPWTSDAFNTWYDSNISQYRLNINTAKANAWVGGITSMAGSAAGAAVGAAGSGGSGAVSGGSGGISGAASGLINAISLDYSYSALSEDLTRTADSVGGNITSSMFNYVHGRMGYTFRIKTIKREYAKRLDNFFTRFGYRVGTLKKIDLKTLPRGYKYIETQGANVLEISQNGWPGGFPVGAVAVIKKAFDSGITIWKDPNKVGDYGDWLVD